MNRRHRSRRLALQGLCCLDAQGPAAMELVCEFIDDSTEPAEVGQDARSMLQEAFADTAESDRLLARHAKRWDVGRLAMVDRNILRLAICEIRRGRAPVKVVISEAIRLAKEFSTAESSRFVNGVLDAVAKEISRDARDARDNSS